jgi:hypothetical protein
MLSIDLAALTDSFDIHDETYAHGGEQYDVFLQLNCPRTIRLGNNNAYIIITSEYPYLCTTLPPSTRDISWRERCRSTRNHI